MSIQELLLKFKGVYKNPEFLLTLLIVSVSGASFYLGRLSNEGNSPRIEQISQSAGVVLSQEATEEPDAKSNITPQESETNEVKEAPASSEQGKFVASKSGTKYHLPWCAGAKQIKESNKIWFESKEEAERAGYTPASNCKGI